VRVKLTKDLTRYDERLVIGAEGDTCEPQSKWARSNDNFVGVRFDNGACLDLVCSGLEVIDVAALKQASDFQKRLEADAASATNAELRVGPKGGFRSLSFSYEGGSYCTGFRDEANLLIAIIRKNGINVRRVVQPK
jgi:hypothetical protein